MQDCQFYQYKYRHPEVAHLYGENVHIVLNPYLLTQLAELCAKGTRQPALSAMLRELYSSLVRIVISQEFPLRTGKVETRMIDITERGVFEGPIINTTTQVAVVDVPRAGSEPAMVCFDIFNRTLNPEGVRKDTLEISREVDAQGRVTGAKLYKAKIGGQVKGRIVVIPDPMGATGSTICKVIEQYRSKDDGAYVTKFIAIHLIVTPEYLKKLKSEYPECVVYAVRLDRGLSSDEVLQSLPGTSWDQEKGLTDHQYIVPGAGGLGEVLTGSVE